MAYYNSETIALLNQIVPTPTSSWLEAADALISTLKGAGIWQTLDLFYCFATSGNGYDLNWVNTSVGLLTEHGTLTKSTNQYIASDGSTGYLSSSFGVNSGNAQDGNAEFGYFVLNDDTVDEVSPFQTTGNKSFLGLQAANTTMNNLTASLNTSTAASFSSQWSSTVGHFVLQQNNTTAQLQFFLDGSSIGTSTQTHSADSGTVQLLRTISGAYTTRQVAFVHYGSALTASQQLAFSKALYNFLAILNVRPQSGEVGGNQGPTNVAPYKHCALGDGKTMQVPLPPAYPSAANEFQGNGNAYPYAAILVNNPNFVSLLRLEVHPGDYWPSDVSTNITRAQFNTENALSIPWQSTCDLSYSFFIEAGSKIDTNDFNDIMDFHDTYNGVNCGPTHAIDPGTGKYYVWGLWNETQYINQPIGSGGATGSLVTLAFGVWHHVRTNWRLDNANAGFLNSWLDGVQILSFPVNTNYGFGNPNGAPFWQQISLYRGETSGGAPPMAIWYANIEFDKSGSSPFASRITNPLPVPNISGNLHTSGAVL